jgi:5-formyltetrahydrofolate cyclo-ligase
MTKAELRKQLKVKRQQLSAEEVEARSSQICTLFFQKFDLTGIQYLHSFLPITRLKEVNTWPIINLLQSEFSDIRIVFPKINPEDLSMESFIYDKNLILEENTWGITEPVQGNRLAAYHIDIILLPLLGFDTRGYRVGYGKGFYDRFLTTCRNDILKIGLSMEEPVNNSIDNINNFDIPMDYCITPQRVWHFGRKLK